MQMIDVLKRLAALENQGSSAVQNKVISESRVSECGMVSTEDFSNSGQPASINMTAGSAGELGDLLKTLSALSGTSVASAGAGETLSEPPAPATQDTDADKEFDMRAMIDKLNPDSDDEGEEEVSEYDNSPADPLSANAFDSEEFAHHENQPGAADGRAQTSNPRAVTFESLMAEYAQFKEQEITESNGRRVKGKGYDNPEKDSTPLKGEVPDNPWHDARSAKFSARQAKGKLVKGSAQSAKQPDDDSDLDEESQMPSLKKYKVSCSQCGNTFNRDKNVGYSHCRDHRKDAKK